MSGAATSETLLEVEHLKKYFPVRKGLLIEREVARVHAIDDVSFTVREGETVGLVGESGCGKTTTLRCIMRLMRPTAGEIAFGGLNMAKAGRRKLKPVRRELQMVFQDPFASLNPRKKIGAIVAAPLRVAGMSRAESRRRAAEILERVGLEPEHSIRYPHEFSGGQRQRVGLARALVTNPRMIALDEPVSALDVSVQAQIVNLLDDLQSELGLAYLFVTHDLGVVRHVSDRIIVMYLGKIMEVSAAAELYSQPIHAYTDAMLTAAPIPDPKENREHREMKTILKGEVPSPMAPPSGCRFHPRCPRQTEICRAVEPPLAAYSPDHLAACHHPANVTDEDIRRATRSPLSPASASDVLPSDERAAAEREAGGPGTSAR